LAAAAVAVVERILVLHQTVATVGFMAVVAVDVKQGPMESRMPTVVMVPVVLL
jgi:hypothetical protein